MPKMLAYALKMLIMSRRITACTQSGNVMVRRTVADNLNDLRESIFFLVGSETEGLD
jgi:hypothetical protein